VVDALQGGAGTSTHMNWNEVIASRASQLRGRKVRPHDHVNRHQSTNDVFPTAVKVAGLYGLRELEPAVISLLEACQEKERAFADVAKLGRTQLRDAVPTTLGRSFGTYATALGRDRWRLQKCAERLRVVNLGGTAIGTGIAAPRDYIFAATDHLRALTGLNLARAENLQDATANHDAFVEVSGILRAHAVNLAKFARDLRLLFSGPAGGLGELELPAVQPGSSLMPGKVNPVVPEMVQQVAWRVMAHDFEINQVAMGGELELNAFLPLLADALLNALDLLRHADELFAERCVAGITANAARCREQMERSREVVTALVPLIGHEAAVRLAQYMDRQACTVREANAALQLLPPEDLDQLLQADRLTALGWRPRP